MNLRPVVVGLGLGVVTFGLVTVGVIEVVRVAPVAGILGVIAGGVGAVAVAVGGGLLYRRLDPTGQSLFETIAAFGYALVAVGVAVYLGARVDTTVAVAAAAVAAVFYLVGSSLVRRRA